MADACLIDHQSGWGNCSNQPSILLNQHDQALICPNEISRSGITLSMRAFTPRPMVDVAETSSSLVRVGRSVFGKHVAPSGRSAARHRSLIVSKQFSKIYVVQNMCGKLSGDEVA